jgi:hypothetical protein
VILNRLLTIICRGDSGGYQKAKELVKNKSDFLRETIMKTILKRFEDEHPTLWKEDEPDLFNQNVT